MGSGKRPMLGKQKIEMKKIENEEARQVCFSKRRAGIFKKANELCTLCGAEIGVIVFSPAGKSFSFGHPNVESIVERFLPDSNTQQQSKIVEVSAGEVESEAHLLARRHAEVMGRLEDERLRRDYLKEQMKEKLSWVECSHSWMKEDLQNLDMEQLELYEDALNQIKKKVHRRSEELLVESSNSYYRALAGIDGNSLSNWTNYYHDCGNQQMQNPVFFNGVRGNGFF